MKATANAHELFGPVLRRIETGVSLSTTRDLDDEIGSLQDHLHGLKSPNA